MRGQELHKYSPFYYCLSGFPASLRQQNLASDQITLQCSILLESEILHSEPCFLSSKPQLEHEDSDLRVFSGPAHGGKAAVTELLLPVTYGPGFGVVGGHPSPFPITITDQPSKVGGRKNFVSFLRLARARIALYLGSSRIRRLLNWELREWKLLETQSGS